MENILSFYQKSESEVSIRSAKIYIKPKPVFIQIPKFSIVIKPKIPLSLEEELLFEYIIDAAIESCKRDIEN